MVFYSKPRAFWDGRIGVKGKCADYRINVFFDVKKSCLNFKVVAIDEFLCQAYLIYS